MNTCGVLFDLDDTLVAFDAVTNQSWKEVCLEYTTSKPGLNPEALFAAIRKVSDWYWSDPERHRIGRNNMPPARRSIVREAFLTMDLPEADADAVAERYSTVRLENMYLLPGAQSTLDLLLSRGYRLGLLTNGDGETQRYKIERFGLAKYFETILIEGETRLWEAGCKDVPVGPVGARVDAGTDLHGRRQPELGCGGSSTDGY